METGYGKTLRGLLAIVMGNALLAFCTVAFLAPTGIISGGTAGVGLCMQAYFRVPISVTYAMVNIICFLAGLVILGRRFAAATLLSTLLCPAILRCFETLLRPASLTDHLFLCSVLAGVLVGLGVGIVVRQGASTGGLDIPPMIANRATGISVGTVMLMQNVVILAAQVPVSDLRQILYGIVQVVLTSVTVDLVVRFGQKTADAE